MIHAHFRLLLILHFLVRFFGERRGQECCIHSFDCRSALTKAFIFCTGGGAALDEGFSLLVPSAKDG